MILLSPSPTLDSDSALVAVAVVVDAVEDVVGVCCALYFVCLCVCVCVLSI